MIAEFTVENFCSFKAKNTFSFLAAKDKELLEANTFVSDKNVRFLKSAVIYGANASGKTNFFKALSFFFNFSVFSGPHSQVDDPIGVVPFALSKQTESVPSNFEIVFFIKNDGEEIRYRYGLSVNEERVESEYLFALYAAREVKLFMRTAQEINCTPHFKEGTRGKPSVRNNCSLLSVCGQNNGEISSQIIKYFKKIIVMSGLQDAIASSKKESSLPEYKKKIIDFLKYADIQVTDYKVEYAPAFGDMPDSDVAALLRSKYPHVQHEKILFGHTVYDEGAPIGECFFEENVESAGTRKLFLYSKRILGALENGTPLFIDEFDTMLHPLIIEGVLKLFNSPITNPKNAQLVISCHAVTIMTNKILRRDQIWFCEKDQYGATDLYSLVEYKEPVRKDASYSKNYLQGKYGAIPYLDEILLRLGC
jgi:hypothetical protein